MQHKKKNSTYFCICLVSVYTDMVNNKKFVVVYRNTLPPTYHHFYLSDVSFSQLYKLYCIKKFIFLPFNLTIKTREIIEFFKRCYIDFMRWIWDEMKILFKSRCLRAKHILTIICLNFVKEYEIPNQLSIMVKCFLKDPRAGIPNKRGNSFQTRIEFYLLYNVYLKHVVSNIMYSRRPNHLIIYEHTMLVNHVSFEE